MDKGDHMWEASTLAENEIEAVISKHFPGKDWSVEWRSVVDENSTHRGPFWSLHLFVETRQEEGE